MVKDLSVLEAKRFGTYCCHPDDTLGHAAGEMTDRNISALVVQDQDGYLQGIITRTDLVRACYHHDDWQALRVGDHMSASVVTVAPEDPLARVMELLIDRHIHRVVAVRMEHGKPRPIAVLSAADVVYHMTHEDE